MGPGKVGAGPEVEFLFGDLISNPWVRAAADGGLLAITGAAVFIGLSPLVQTLLLRILQWFSPVNDGIERNP
jgi:hypothetical protein